MDLGDFLVLCGKIWSTSGKVWNKMEFEKVPLSAQILAQSLLIARGSLKKYISKILGNT